MDQQAIDRLTAKSDRQVLLMELQDYRLPPTEAEAIVQQLQQCLDEDNPDQHEGTKTRKRQEFDKKPGALVSL
ncbi:MAG: hypothetical protein ACETWR_09665 [Anaerolineae bacterium]